MLCYGFQVQFNGDDYFQLLEWCEIQTGNWKKKIWLQEKNPEPLSEGQLMLSSVLHNVALASCATAAAALLLVFQQ